MPDGLLSDKRSGDSDSEKDMDWRSRPLLELTLHIVNIHHYSARLEMPHLNGLLVQVALAHAAEHPELRRIKALFHELRSSLSEHMHEEEATLFPYIRVMEDAASGKGHLLTPPTWTLRAPIQTMSHGHANVRNLLKEMRQASSNYTASPDACFSCKILFEKLAAFDRSLVEHLYLEDEILFPRAIERRIGKDGRMRDEG